MPTLLRRLAFSAVALLISAGCNEPGRRLDGSLNGVEVIATPAPEELVPEPAPQLAPLGEARVLEPQPVYLEPLPPAARHVVSTSAAPAGALSLDTVQSIEVDVEVSGGTLGHREIAVAFISPQGVVWERQVSLIDARAAAAQRVHFSLPVASTFIEDQQLSGTWQVTTMDEGVVLGTTTFTLGGMTP